jgi:hypothetical protein
VARRSASLWATDDYLQSLHSLVPAPYLAAHFRENGGRRSSFTGVEHMRPIWPVATLRPVTNGAVAISASATGLDNSFIGQVRTAVT